MLHIFTASVSIFTLFMLADFATGLLDLWNSTKAKVNHPLILDTTPANTSLEATEEPSPWDEPFTLPALSTAPATALSVTFQLCLPAALEVATSAPVDLASLGIRALKKLASEAKVKGYGKMTKLQLITALI